MVFLETQKNKMQTNLPNKNANFTSLTLALCLTLLACLVLSFLPFFLPSFLHKQAATTKLATYCSFQLP
jgi:hypothetical protein